VPVAKLLIKRGANVNAVSSFNQTAIMWAAMVGSVDLTKMLLDAKADITIKMSGDPTGQLNGATALWLAQQSGFPNVEKILKKAGAKE
jgi:ankyrin repeat protein